MVTIYSICSHPKLYLAAKFLQNWSSNFCWNLFTSPKHVVNNLKVATMVTKMGTQCSKSKQAMIISNNTLITNFISGELAHWFSPKLVYTWNMLPTNWATEGGGGQLGNNYMDNIFQCQRVKIPSGTEIAHSMSNWLTKYVCGCGGIQQLPIQFSHPGVNGLCGSQWAGLIIRPN